MWEAVEIYQRFITFFDVLYRRTCSHSHSGHAYAEYVVDNGLYLFSLYIPFFLGGACIFEDSSPNCLLVLALKKMENVGWNNSNYDIRFCKFNRLLTCCCCTI